MVCVCVCGGVSMSMCPCVCVCVSMCPCVCPFRDQTQTQHKVERLRPAGVMAVSQVTPTLFLGGADAPLNRALVSRKNITLIVNATLSHASPCYPGVECVRVPVADLPGARLGDHFDRVAERIHGNCAGATLVHCAVGASRSPALVMAYLMRYRAVTLRQAHRWVQESRPFVSLNAGFWEQLLQYERRLYGKNTVRVAAAREPPPRIGPPPPHTCRHVPRSTMMSQPHVTMSPNKLRRKSSFRAKTKLPTMQL